jgi:glycosyltransferase involved in cell wall biosynthesis
VRLVTYTDANHRAGAEVWLAALLTRLGPHVDATVMGTDRAILEFLAGHREGTDVVIVPPAVDKRDLAAMRAHQRAFARVRPDIVQFNLVGMPGLSLYALATAVASRRRKVVAVEHQPFPPWSKASAMLQRWVERRLAAHVAVSDATARTVEKFDRLPAGSVRTIHNGIDVVDVRPVAKCTDGPLIGAAARLHRAKGLDVLVRAMVQLPGASLAILGQGDEQENLERLAAELGVDDRLHMLGWQERPQDHIATFDIFAMPSRVEPFGLAIAEAMRAVLPVVASNVGGIPEVVADGETGILVPRDDVDALASALRRLLDDPNLRARMGEAGERRFAECFTLDRMVASYEALYAEILGR